MRATGGRARAIGLPALTSDVATIGLFVIASFGALHFAKYFFAPTLAAIVAGLLVSRIGARLEKYGLPPVASAATLLLGMLVFLSALTYGVMQPLASWIERAPVLWYELRSLFQAIEEPLSDVAEIRKSIRGLMGADGGIVVTESSGDEVQQVVTAAPALMGQVLIFIGTFFFFLVGRRQLKAAIVSLYERRSDQLRVGRLLRSVELSVAHYLVSIATINFCFGVIVAFLMWAVGLPEPLLWGALAFALNFIPYLGPAIMTLLILGAGLVSFGGYTTPLLAVGLFVGSNLLEGQFVTPAIIGRNATLNPLLVFCSLAFWLWFWGAIGAFLAVPLLLIARDVTVNSRAADQTCLPDPGTPMPPSGRRPIS